MTYQYSITVRDAKLDAVQTAIGSSPILKLFSGSEPANCAAADPSGLICQMTLPAVWMQPAAGGIKQLNGLWQGLTLTSGTMNSFRIYDPTGTTCHIQGSVSLLGHGGDMQMDNNVSSFGGATVTVIQYTLTAGNA